MGASGFVAFWLLSGAAPYLLHHSKQALVRKCKPKSHLQGRKSCNQFDRKGLHIRAANNICMVFKCRSENRGLNFHTMRQPDSHLVQLASQLHSYPQRQSSISAISTKTLVVDSRAFFSLNPIHCSFSNHSLVSRVVTAHP